MKDVWNAIFGFRLPLSRSTPRSEHKVPTTVTSPADDMRGTPPTPDAGNNPVPALKEPVSLGTLLLMFLKIGSLGFGGGMATIALMEQEFVRKRSIIPIHEFVHGVGLGHLLGGFAVNVAAFIGFRLFGSGGAVLSAAAFLAPSFMLLLLLSELYFRNHAIPALQGTMAGVAPVVIALILGAAWSIGRQVLTSWQSVLIATASLVAALNRVNPAFILLAAGGAGITLSLKDMVRATPANTKAGTKPAVTRILSLVLPVVSTSVMNIFVTFLKIGLIFFGGGFVLIPILQSRLVTELKWLTPHEFVDGLAISSLTPGPIAIIVAFAGYHLSGVAGAFAATVALFGPGVFLMLLVSRQYDRFRADGRVRYFLAGVNPAVVSLVLSSALSLGRNTVLSWHAYLLLALSFALLTAFRWHPGSVLALGAVAGYLRLIPRPG